MANRSQVANLRNDRFVNSTSRYSNTKIIYYGDQNKITFATYQPAEVPLDPTDRYMVVPAGMEYRPDLVSDAVYGLPDFWWKIMEVNGIKDLFDFKAGTNIRIPGNFFT